MKKRYFIILLLSLSIGASALAATWSPPTSNPPSGNAEAPINVSTGPQTKFGGLTVGSAGSGLLKAANKFFVGSVDPSAAFGTETDYLMEVQGKIGASQICGLNNANCVELPLNLSGGSGTLPTGALNQTLRYNGTSWAANSGLLINSANQVGIGNIVPTKTLTLPNTGSYQNYWDATTGYLLTGGRVQSKMFYDYDDSTYFLDPSNAGTALRVAGNTALGTSGAPTTRLQVVGSSVLSNNTAIDPDAYLNTTISGTVADGSGWSVQGIGGNGGAAGRGWAIGNSGGTTYFGSQNGSGVNSLQTFMQVAGNRNVFLVPTSGNVNVGSTATPDAKLDVIGDIQATSNIWAKGGMTVNTSAVNDFTVYDASNNPILAARGSTQRVGVGTANPSTKLEVLGDITSRNSGNNVLFLNTSSIQGTVSVNDAGAYGSSRPGLYIGTAGSQDVSLATNGVKRVTVAGDNGDVAVNGRLIMGNGKTLQLSATSQPPHLCNAANPYGGSLYFDTAHGTSRDWQVPCVCSYNPINNSGWAWRPIDDLATTNNFCD